MRCTVSVHRTPWPRSAARPARYGWSRSCSSCLLRRCFAGRDPREITGYVRDLLEWRELPTRGRLARWTEALIRAVLGEPALAAAVPAGCRYEIMCHVVADLVRPPGAPPGVLEALIEQAERRVDRYPEPAADRRP